MGKKLYEETETGGICFKSERKPWEVRVPNYVYDLWMPILGVVDIGVYSVYCRLERENIVKAISLDNIARACRIGKSRLYGVNKRLEKCGFIRVAPPEGWQKLAHHTTEITVLDPPPEVPAWAIKEYCQIKGGYQPLSPWLVKDDGKAQIEPPNVPNGTMGEPGQDVDKAPNGTPNVETLGLKPLGVETLDVEIDFPENQQPTAPSPFQQGDDYLGVSAKCAAKREEAGTNPAVPLPAGGSFALGDHLITVACACLGRSEPQGDKRKSARAFFEKALKAEGLLQGDVIMLERAVKCWLDPEGEYAFFLSQYALTPKHGLALRHFGIVLSKATSPAAATSTRRARDVEAMEASLAALEERQAARSPPVKGDWAWEAAKRELQLQTDKHTFETWVANTVGLGREDGVYTVAVADPLKRDWLENRLGKTAEKTLVGILGEAVEVRFVEPAVASADGEGEG